MLAAAANGRSARSLFNHMLVEDIDGAAGILDGAVKGRSQRTVLQHKDAAAKVLQGGVSGVLARNRQLEPAVLGVTVPLRGQHAEGG